MRSHDRFLAILFGEDWFCINFLFDNSLIRNRSARCQNVKMFILKFRLIFNKVIDALLQILIVELSTQIRSNSRNLFILEWLMHFENSRF